MRKNARYGRIPCLFLFFASLLLFAGQTLRAMAVVNFHADLLKSRGTVVLDAGHGGEDGGAVGVNGVMEKDVNLAISLKLQALLEENRFNVIMIRDEDGAVGDQSLKTVAERKRSDLQARLKTVEAAGDCIYLSIHQNFFTEGKYDGAQVFYSGNREESAVLAEAIRQSIVSSLQPENKRQNKVADSGIYILAHCQAPAVLVECGFLSNPAEAEKLSSGDYQSAMANAICRGLLMYLQENAL